MPLEPELEKSVQQVTSDMGLSESVSKRLVAWLEEMSHSEVSNEDMNKFFDQTIDALGVEEF